MTSATPFTEEELLIMAFEVRAKLEAKFGLSRVNRWTLNDPDVATAFVKEVYLSIAKRVHDQ